VKTSSSEEPEASKRSGHQSLNRGELWSQLGNAIHLRSAEDQVLWSIFGVFWAANAILLVALFQGGKFPTFSVGMVISVVGTLLSIVWHKIQGRALGHVKRHEELMKRLERELGFEDKYAVSAEINREGYSKYLGKGKPARKLMPICSLVAAILWGLAFIVFLFLFFAYLVCK